MAATQQNQTPRNVLNGLFGSKFLDDPEALSGMASSLGIGPSAASGNPATSAPSPSPDASGAANAPIPGPVQGVVPKSFNEWAQDPVNLAKIPRQINNSPLPGANPSIPPLIARPPEDSMPSAAPVAPQGQDVAPRGVTQGALASPAPAQQPPFTTPTPELFPSRADWLKANPNAAAIPLPPHQYGTRGSIAMALATLGDTMGAALTGGRPVVGPHWLEQVQAGQEYQRQLPVLTNQAQTAAYEKAQEEAGKSASIQASQAGTAHVIAETNALLGGGPFYEQAGKVRQEIQQMWQSGNLAPADFDKAVALKMQGLAPNVQRLIPVDFGQQVKALPQQPPAFKTEGGAVQPVTWQGRQYGVTPEPNEPPEITAARNRAMASQQSGEFAKAAPEIVAQIGAYPINGTAEEKAAWGKKAEQIKINEAASPKMIVQQAGFAHEASLAPELAAITKTTQSGRQYINAEDAPGKQGAYIRKAAAEAGIPVVDKDVAGTLTEIDTAKANQQYMLDTIGKKLASDPSGRLYSGPKNTIEKLMQTDPELAAVGTFRNAAIQSMRAVAGSKGLRINQYEVQMAIDNDIPKITDTLPVAQQKLTNLRAFLENSESAHLTPNRALPPRGFAGGEQLPPQAAAQLQEGQETTFANGQTWTKKNGQATRVK